MVLSASLRATWYATSSSDRRPLTRSFRPSARAPESTSVGDALQVETPRRRRRPGLLARAPGQQALDVFRRLLDHRPDERPHHVTQDAIGRNLELERLVAPVPRRRLHHAHEDLVLRLRRREGTEVVLATQEVGRVGERVLVERP